MTVNDEDAQDVRDHEAGEHADAIVVDCYRCREEAGELGMALPDGDGAASRPGIAPPGAGFNYAGRPSFDAMVEWQDALIDYGARRINRVMYTAVRDRALLAIERAEKAARA